MMVAAGDRIRAGDHPTELGYAEVTANQNTITTEVDLTGLTVTVNVPAGRTIKIHGHVHILPSATTARWILFLKEGTTVLATGRASSGTNPTATTQEVFRRLAPSTGSHTYKLSLQGVGTGNVSLNADSGGAFGPAFIQVMLVDA